MRSNLLILLSLPLLFSCSGQEELTDSSGEPESIPAGMSRVSFRSGPQSQCVYIFRKEGDAFRYDSKLDSGWSPDGKITTQLRVGDYKFLFTGPLNGQLGVLPDPLDKTVVFEQMHFVSQTDAMHKDAILPAEELFLPEPDVANSVYAIQGGEEIECTLKRRVSQLEFVLNRGYKDGDQYVALPYSEGHNILDLMKELRVEIAGVARECNYLGTSGVGNIYCAYVPDEMESVDTNGFATFRGPFVFPPAEDGKVDLKLTLVSPSGQEYPPVELSEKLEINQKLIVNLWLASAGFDIVVSFDRTEITERTNGDTGMWE